MKILVTSSTGLTGKGLTGEAIVKTKASRGIEVREMSKKALK